MSAAVLAYVSRPWSCGLTLAQFTPESAVPYARFDPHAWGLIFAVVAALLFAAPVLWLGSKVFLSGTASFRLFGRARDTRTTVLSVIIALSLGAPMHSQLAYLIALPMRVAAPIAISSASWFLIVELGRTAAVEGNLLGKRGTIVAGAVALIVTVPKLALLASALLRA